MIVSMRDALLAEAAAEVLLPDYDRSQLRAGIAHIGVGGFHRAHQALAIDRLLADGLATDWAICGIGLLPGDRRMQQILAAQDGRYVLVEKAPDGSRTARVIGSIIDYLYAPDDPEAVVERLAAPETRIVSLTVTEGGYTLPPPADAGAPPTTFGLIVAALRRRRERGHGPFTVMSCDNIRHNGSVARSAVTGFARRVDPELAEWIEAEVAFPSSMVDRITPVTTDADRAEVTERFGIPDGWPVVAEPFFQWVLEDTFAAGRPPLDRAEVQLVADVEPYELMKLRLLNASHQGIAYFGHLMGYRYAHEAAGDPTFARYLLNYMHAEAIPTLRPVPGINLDEYTRTLIERFSNAEIKDTVARLAAESSDRIPTWLVPVIRENLDAGRSVRISAAIVASWARYAEGIDEQGRPIEVVDRLATERLAAARGQGADALAFVRNRELFADLAERPGFVEPYTWALDSLHTRGAAATVADLAGDVGGRG